MTSTARASLTIVAANLAVYFVMLGAWMMRGFIPGLPETLASVLAFPHTASSLYEVPWTVVTYMFTHVSFVHLTVNMLWLIGFGPMLKGNGLHTTAAYLAGGICGALAFFLCPDSHQSAHAELAGASASVLSIVMAATCLSPDRKLSLLLIGDVRLKWVALAAIITICAGSPTLSPVTGAHFGGAFAGILLGVTLRLRHRLAIRKGMEEARRHTRRLALIHKAGRSGFASLSEHERLELFNLNDQYGIRQSQSLR